jgi:hypothetical protein
VTGAILLIVFGGFLLGGAYSLRSQKAPVLLTAGTLVAGLLALAAGILWSI